MALTKTHKAQSTYKLKIKMISNLDYGRHTQHFSKMINHELALKILGEIHTGNNGIEEVDEMFLKEQDFHNTMTALSVDNNPDGMIQLTKPDYLYIIKGSSSGAWPPAIHDFLKRNGYQSKL